jgi:hypothetical protein
MHAQCDIPSDNLGFHGYQFDGAALVLVIADSDYRADLGRDVQDRKQLSL